MLPPLESGTVGTRVPIKFLMKLKKDEPEISKSMELENDVFVDDVETTPFKKIFPPAKLSQTKKRNPLQQHAYLRNIRFRKSSIGYKGALLNIHKYKLKASSCPDMFRNSMATFPKDEEPVSVFLKYMRYSFLPNLKYTIKNPFR